MWSSSHACMLASVNNSRVIQLPRGGTYVRTRVGAVQFGLPPETIKDSMTLGLDIPQVFIVPNTMFDRRRGLSVAEVEFPTYYNFFALKRRARLVVDADLESRIRAIFQETLFGPSALPAEVEFAADYPADARPDFVSESEFFRAGGGRQRIRVEDLVEFISLNAGIADLGDGVSVRSTEIGYSIWESSEQLCAFGALVELPARASACEHPKQPFRGPEFGVTVLGGSHGFDPKGKTTGFLLWLGGRALLVDPPTDSTDYLREHGVSPKAIDGVILTHCHADHDAGTFQKLLEEGKIKLFTTPYILGSFLRKYAALSGLSEDTLRRTFEFCPIRIGSPLYLRGGELAFRYKLHSIPAIGIEAFYGGKSLAISGDTLYEPFAIAQLLVQGVIGKARHDELVSFPAHHQLILHEAGIPPLHTPVAALLALPEHTKERLRLVHIASTDVPQGLHAARIGLENTSEIDVSTPRFADAIECLDAFAMVDILRELPLARARALLQVSRAEQFQPGDRIVKEGERGISFYVIRSGTVAVIRNNKTLKRYTTGDYFGETALILDQPRRADVKAETAVEVFAIDRDNFLSLLRGSETLDRLKRLARGQSEGTWELLAKNSMLLKMSSAQKTQLETFFTPEPVAAGAQLWRAGEVPKRAFLLDTADVVIDEVGETPFRSGAFLGDFDALLQRAPATTSARVVSAGRVFSLDVLDLASFCGDNPGALLSFIGVRFCE
jgi:CRP-like cAMP-binding protein/phosphoribosyl 1,2-cyclic phosphodiesterase